MRQINAETKHIEINDFSFLKVLFKIQHQDLGNVNVFVIIVIVPPNVAAVDRVPRQAVAFRLVLGRKEDRREAAAIGEAKEEAPVVVRSKIERILVNLTQTFEPFCFVPIDVSLDARLAF